MANILSILRFWWQSQQFRAALSQGQLQKTRRLLHLIQRSGAKFSPLEQQFYEKVLLQDQLDQAKRELTTIRHDYTKLLNTKTLLESQLSHANQELVTIRHDVEQILRDKTPCLPQAPIINTIHNVFGLEQIDPYLWQCRGIDADIFERLEIVLVQFLNQRLKSSMKSQLLAAHKELKKLTKSQDPDYSVRYIDYAYLLEYFLDNIYCTFLAWNFIYESGLLKPSLKILDVGAGPATVLFGLGAFLEILQRETANHHLLPLPTFHICYHFQEQQKLLQNAGQTIWQNFIDPKSSASNTYWRVDTSDLFSYAQRNESPLPGQFFDFIVVCHCFFWNPQFRDDAYAVYGRLFRDHLAQDGYALFVIQQYKLFSLINSRSPNKSDEMIAVHELCRRVNLKLVWFKYLTSSGARGKINNFSELLKVLPSQTSLSKVYQKYLDTYYMKRFVLDDYAIILKNK